MYKSGNIHKVKLCRHKNNDHKTAFDSVKNVLLHTIHTKKENGSCAAKIASCASSPPTEGRKYTVNWHVPTRAISHPFLSPQGSDGPPGKIGFPGPQVKHWGIFLLFHSFLSYIFWCLCSSGEARHQSDLEDLHDTSSVEAHSQKQHIALEERTVLGSFLHTVGQIYIHAPLIGGIWEYLLSLQLKSTSENDLGIYKFKWSLCVERFVNLMQKRSVH